MKGAISYSFKSPFKKLRSSEMRSNTATGFIAIFKKIEKRVNEIFCLYFVKWGIQYNYGLDK